MTSNAKPARRVRRQQALTDEAVAAALAAAAAMVRERRGEVLAANDADVEAAAGRLDEGTIDRLRLDDGRVAVLERQLLATAALDPLEREIGSRTLANGLVVSERRIPIGVVGANFEARPNVALDVAGQLLKSLNAVVLRTGAAALRTVTVLVDDVLRPALEEAGLPPEAVGLVRHADREGARVLVSMPSLVPLVILRGSGPSTAELVRLAAQNDVRTLAHAEGGGVLYVHAAADRGKALAPRRGQPRPTRRLQPAQPRAGRPWGRGARSRRCSRLFADAGSGCARRRSRRRAARPADRLRVGR